MASLKDLIAEADICASRLRAIGQEIIELVSGSSVPVPTPAPPAIVAPSDVPSTPAPPPVQGTQESSGYEILGITATVFGDEADERSGEWGPLAYRSIAASNGDGLKNAWVALPARVPAGTMVQVRRARNGIKGPWLTPWLVADVGPWNTSDSYWETKGARPQAESGVDTRGRKTNKAGIDLTPLAMAQVLEIPEMDVWKTPRNAVVDVRVIYPSHELHANAPSAHFSWAELTASATALKYGLDNTPDTDARARLSDLAQELLEKVRTWAGAPVRLGRAFSTDAVDAAIHRDQGTAQSNEKEHTKGYAADIAEVTGKTLVETFNYIVGALEFDRIIWEDNHIHISYVRGANRRAMLRAP